MVLQTALRRTLVPSVHAVRYCGARGSAVHTLALRAPLSVREAHRLCTAHFVVHNIDEPQSSSQYIISHVGALGYRYSQFMDGQDKLLDTAQVAELIRCCALRLERMPVQYILGNWDFCGIEFQCAPPVLIPRPETEELVEMVVSDLGGMYKHSSSKKACRLLDIGCGSGVIGISILAHLAGRLPGLSCEAIDVNPAAVQLSSMNADTILQQQSTPRDRYVSIISSIKDFAAVSSNQHRFHCIVSNPPYIPTQEMADLSPEVINYESELALHGGEDGLDIVKDILLLGPRLLHPQGSRTMWLEAADSHPEVIVSRLIREINPLLKPLGLAYDTYNSIAIKDFSGRSRFVCLKVIFSC